MLVEIIRPHNHLRPGRVIDVTEGVADALIRTRTARLHVPVAETTDGPAETPDAPPPPDSPPADPEPEPPKPAPKPKKGK